MDKFTTLTGVAAPLPMRNVDTDMIIPKQFLKTIKRTGLGKSLFFELRYDDAGEEIAEFVLNQPAYRGAKILVTGENFGCGSSREHAPWALLDLGIRAVISSSIADIFTANALKNGLLPVVADSDTHAWLLANPWTEVTVDLQTCTLTTSAGHTTQFSIDRFARKCLLEGIDEMGYLLGSVNAIEAFELTHTSTTQ